MRELKTGIFVFDNYIAPYDCETILSAVKCIPMWQDHADQRHTADMDDGFSCGAGAILRQRFLSAVNQMLDEFRKYDDDNQIPMLDDSFVHQYRFMKYTTGGKFHSHFDANTTGTGKMITGIVYLNDDYEGGVLSYPRHGVELKPKLGDIVFHPTIYTHPHMASPVTCGEKWICSVFCTIIPIPSR